MRNSLSAAVEDVLGRKVIAFMSANHIDPDLAAEIFLLAPLETGHSAVAPQNEAQNGASPNAVDHGG
ncbi:hypothetical protein BH20ACT19_BH20ACT19_00870 [soil metagenome]